MKRADTYLILAVASLMTASCELHEGLYMQVPEQEDITVNISRPNSTVVPSEELDYALRFWTGDISGSWGMSLKPGNVDTYNYGFENLAVTGGRSVYPYDNSPVFAVGYYPATKLLISQTDGADDYGSFTINTTDSEGGMDWLNQPGLVDVCTTDMEQGTESRPFISDFENELQYRHTQVQLNFRYRRSENLNGRVAQIWATIPQTLIADKWTFTEPATGQDGEYIPGGYLPSADQTDTGSLIFSSTDDWYERFPNPQGYDMKYSYLEDPDNPANYKVTELKHCYVLPSETMFGPRRIDGMDVQHITFLLNVVIISNDVNIENTRINEYVSVPLKQQDGRFWTSTVQGGDSFTITVLIEQNRLELWAQKSPWEQGGWLTIPLNPNNPDEHEKPEDPTT